MADEPTATAAAPKTSPQGEKKRRRLVIIDSKEKTSDQLNLELEQERARWTVSKDVMLEMMADLNDWEKCLALTNAWMNGRTLNAERWMDLGVGKRMEHLPALLRALAHIIVMKNKSSVANFHASGAVQLDELKASGLISRLYKAPRHTWYLTDTDLNRSILGSFWQLVRSPHMCIDDAITLFASAMDPATPPMVVSTNDVRYVNIVRNFPYLAGAAQLFISAKQMTDWLFAGDAVHSFEEVQGLVFGSRVVHRQRPLNFARDVIHLENWARADDALSNARPAGLRLQFSSVFLDEHLAYPGSQPAPSPPPKAVSIKRQFEVKKTDMIRFCAGSKTDRRRQFTPDQICLFQYMLDWVREPFSLHEYMQLNEDCPCDSFCLWAPCKIQLSWAQLPLTEHTKTILRKLYREKGNWADSRIEAYKCVADLISPDCLAIVVGYVWLGFEGTILMPTPDAKHADEVHIDAVKAATQYIKFDIKSEVPAAQCVKFDGKAEALAAQPPINTTVGPAASAVRDFTEAPTADPRVTLRILMGAAAAEAHQNGFTNDEVNAAVTAVLTKAANEGDYQARQFIKTRGAAVSASASAAVSSPKPK